MTESPIFDFEDPDSGDRDVIRNIPIDSTLKHIICEQIQTKDVFHIGFYPENNHLDIDVYEFSDFKDIYYEAKERLCDLNIDPLIRYQILNNLLINKYRITKNLEYFGVAHFWSVWK